jgi:hypothetical protein
VNTSGCVCLINSTAVIVLMVSIFSFTGRGGNFGLLKSDSARNVPTRDLLVIHPQLTPINRQNTSGGIFCVAVWTYCYGRNKDRGIRGSAKSKVANLRVVEAR